MQLNEALQIGRNERLIELIPNYFQLSPAPVTVCADGYEVSIQCSEHNYCQPRENILDVSEYSSFELGFPSQSDELLDEYAEDTEDPLNTIYPYVPREVVEALIAKHGDIV
jgi:hypothetical protein